MLGRLVMHGGEWILALDRELVAELRLGPDTPLLVSRREDCVVVMPVRGNASDPRFTDALEECRRRYGEALARRAD